MIYGWISPKGAIYDCEFMAHYDLACEFVDAYGYQTFYNGRFWPADEVLVHNGWVKGYTSMFDRNHIQYYMPQSLTEWQKKILLEDYLEHPEDYDKASYWTLEEYGVIEPTYDEQGLRVNRYSF